jgi:hypothetical protein
MYTIDEEPSPSTWNNYPDIYKFFSFDILINASRKTIDRTNEGFFDAFSAIGGLAALF